VTVNQEDNSMNENEQAMHALADDDCGTFAFLLLRVALPGMGLLLCAGALRADLPVFGRKDGLGEDPHVGILFHSAAIEALAQFVGKVVPSVCDGVERFVTVC
jgi:hypothetical protein